jgi:hypothetical protein
MESSALDRAPDTAARALVNNLEALQRSAPHTKMSILKIVSDPHLREYERREALLTIFRQGSSDRSRQVASPIRIPGLPPPSSSPPASPAVPPDPAVLRRHWIVHKHEGSEPPSRVDSGPSAQSKAPEALPHPSSRGNGAATCPTAAAAATGRPPPSADLPLPPPAAWPTPREELTALLMRSRLASLGRRSPAIKQALVSTLEREDLGRDGKEEVLKEILRSAMTSGRGDGKGPVQSGSIR